MNFICYPKCTTCQRARAYLEGKGLTFEERNIKEENPTYDELKQLWEKSGLPLSKFFNTSGLLYRGMGLKEKIPNMTDEEKLCLLATDGMLVKRPILVTDTRVLLGFREAEWESVLTE